MELTNEMIDNIIKSRASDLPLFYDKMETKNALEPFTTLIKSSDGLKDKIIRMISEYLRLKFELDDDSIHELINKYPFELTFLITENITNGFSYKAIFDKEGIEVVSSE